MEGGLYVWSRYDLANWRSYSRTEDFWGQKSAILGRFALHFQWKTLVHFCANNGLLARLVLWSMFEIFSTKTRVLGIMTCSNILPLKPRKCARFPNQSPICRVFPWKRSAKWPKTGTFCWKKSSVQLWERQFAKSSLFHAPTRGGDMSKIDLHAPSRRGLTAKEHLWFEARWWFWLKWETDFFRNASSYCWKYCDCWENQEKARNPH